MSTPELYWILNDLYIDTGRRDLEALDLLEGLETYMSSLSVRARGPAVTEITRWQTAATATIERLAGSSPAPNPA